MPEEMIKAYLREANELGGYVVLKGLIDGDFRKTLNKVREIGQEDAERLMFDPTIFQRFDISRVPSFVLPIDPIMPCSSESNCESGLHVKARGSVSLRYFLELVDRTGSDTEKEAARKWISL
jgi:type-F conjugative transfer system pilin assembly protein TrbC